MQINISGHHVDLTESIKSYVESKFERLERHNDRITSTQVTLSVDKLIQKAEATVHVSGKDFFADAESEDLYAAIDQLTDKLEPPADQAQRKDSESPPINCKAMMQIEDFLSPSRTRCDVASSKKRALELIANTLADDNPTLNADDIFLSLTARERLGSTGLGHGIAIPHCRINNCPSITAVLIKLEQPIDYAALDDERVDIIFALIVPEEAHDQHLQILALLAERFSQDEFRDNLRAANNHQELFQIATERVHLRPNADLKATH